MRSLPWQRLVIKLEEELPSHPAAISPDGGGDACFPPFREVTFDGLREILKRLDIEHRLGEVLGMHKHTQAPE